MVEVKLRTHVSSATPKGLKFQIEMTYSGSGYDQIGRALTPRTGPFGAGVVIPTSGRRIDRYERHRRCDVNQFLS
ncbi:hypothetical protein [Pusillimonas sp. NJUB218]|uniref:hypothetical protein n=1 Tax=Pusillimonas sp. NJUB218 TaxID=2023230 RepID=UPI0018F79130|nr:hypothetical protein [Pusillimonas sp. NJUB218]